jgi:hypothetical protein
VARTRLGFQDGRSLTSLHRWRSRRPVEHWNRWPRYGNDIDILGMNHDSTLVTTSVSDALVWDLKFINDRVATPAHQVGRV